MHLTLISKIFKMKIISKAISFRCGSLLGISLPMSIGYMKFWQVLFQDIPNYDIVLSISAMVISFFIYVLFWIADFIWGLIASHHESKGAKNWVKSNKLFSSIGKIVAVALFNSSLLVLVMFLLVAKLPSASRFVLFASVFITFIAMLFEFHSIGENIERKTNNKPRIFNFFERLTAIMEKIFFSKITNYFGVKKDIEEVEVKDPENVKPNS